MLDPILAGAVLASCLWLACVNRQVPASYMDEEFHVGQTRTYLAGNWTEWDPKITTPPGLYVVGVAWARAAAAAHVWSGEDAALAAVLRGLGPAFYYVVTELLMQVVRGRRVVTAVASAPAVSPRSGFIADSSSGVHVLSVATFPFVFFFAGLYYTDLASLAAVLGVLYAALYDCTAAAAALGLWGVTLRQTNLVWVAAMYGVAILKDCHVRHVEDVLPALPRLLAATARRGGLVAVLAACAAAGWVNGGIVLGDKGNHAAVFHPTQLVYLAVIFAVFYPLSCIEGALAAVRRPSAATCTLLAAWGAFAVYCLKEHLITHPFTLADNRHYTFYLWRRLQLAQPSLVRYVLVPVSTFGVCGAARLVRRTHTAVVALLAAASAITLIPSPLFEPRYYVVPVVLTLVCACVAGAVTRREALAHVAWHAVVNGATMYLFLARPFTAPDGSVGRFMW